MFIYTLYFQATSNKIKSKTLNVYGVLTYIYPQNYDPRQIHQKHLAKFENLWISLKKFEDFPMISATEIEVRIRVFGHYSSWWFFTNPSETYAQSSNWIMKPEFSG